MSEQEAQQALERMREKVRQRGVPSAKRKAAWVAPTLEDFDIGTVLSFDQTLTKTGFAIVRHSEKGLEVLEGNVIIPKVVAPEGFEKTYAKMHLMKRAISQVVSALGYAVDEIVHEMPSVAGYRTESSLMAGFLVRDAAQEFARGVSVHMVSKQHAAAVLLEPGSRGEKRYITAAVNILVPAEQRKVKRWNQDVHDAVANGLTRLYDRQMQKRENESA